MIFEKKYGLPLYIYVMLWILWHVQSIFVTSSFYSLIFYIPFALMTLVYSFKTIINVRMPKTLKTMALFFIVMLCYGFALFITNDAVRQDNTSFLKSILGAIGPVFTFYYFAREGYIDRNKIYVLFLLLIITSILEFNANQVKILMTENRRYDGVTNNFAYDILGLFPFLFLMTKRPLVQFLSLSVITYYVITGFKRGAILICIILLLVFIYYSLKYTPKNKRWISLILIITLFFAGLSLIGELYNENQYFQYRMQATKEGDSSQRDVIYSTLFYHYLDNNNLLQIIFGEGAYHTVNLTKGLKAHNDWLELLIDCGIFGIVLYIAYWISYIFDLKKVKNEERIFYILFSCFIFTFLRTFFSMSFTNIPLSVSFIMGYGFAAIKSPEIINEE